MFRPQASLPLRIVRTVLVPSGPLLLMIVLVNLSLVAESVAGTLFLVSMAWFFCALILVPALLFRESGSSSGSSDDGGGNGSGPSPPSLPDPGAGGIPLADAEQSRERIRDHARAKRQWWRRRRSREPRQAPVPNIAE